MKNLISLFIALLFPVLIFSQETQKEKTYQRLPINTFFGGGKITSGVYRGLSVNYSQIDGNDAFVFGGRGAWLQKHLISRVLFTV